MDMDMVTFLGRQHQALQQRCSELERQLQTAQDQARRAGRVRERNHFVEAAVERLLQREQSSPMQSKPLQQFLGFVRRP